jgi:hypothetical protein
VDGLTKAEMSEFIRLLEAMTPFSSAHANVGSILLALFFLKHEQHDGARQHYDSTGKVKRILVSSCNKINCQLSRKDRNRMMSSL